MSETVDFSSDNERNLLYPPSSRAPSSAYSIAESSPDIIVISDSDDDDDGDRNMDSLSVVNHAVKEEETHRAIKRESSFFCCILSFNHL
jgi:hypothetical protein